jgi:hypothetical protein
MRSFTCVAAIVLASACGSSDSTHGPDAYTGNHPPPRIIPGGGIGDGPIDGVVNLYVIDDATRAPVAGATVRVGGMDGTTDATGLFVANGVEGPQQISIKATGYRSEMWTGANGANCTANLKAAVDPAVTMANITATITGFDTLPVAANHLKVGVLSYSQDEKASDAENNIATAGNANYCAGATMASQCTFTVTSRTGHVALMAAIIDDDTKGTTTTTDDTYTVIGWAYRTGLTVQDGVNLTGVTMTMVPTSSLVSISASLGSPPLPTSAGLVGIELGTDGVAYLAPAFITATSSSIAKAPPLSTFPGATYRLIAFANNGTTATAASSAVILRGQSSTTLTAPAWIAPPASPTLTITGGMWTPTAGAVVQGAEYNSATDHLLSVTMFDNSGSFTISDVVALPTGATGITAKATALGGTLDVTNFAIDNDLAKVTAFTSQPVTIN